MFPWLASNIKSSLYFKYQSGLVWLDNRKLALNLTPIDSRK